MTLSFLADEHVKRVFVTELRANGYDVAWAAADYEAGATDTDHLETAVDTGRVILTNDTDFARLHEDFDHAGIVLYDDQDMSVTAFIRGVKAIERFVPASELRGNVVWLDEWIG